ncbi:MAG TPA: hypothetical protein H9878_09440 [Candidatus Dietzia merdigallinarum]|nr:hypothetical protein [Candidatus Dietzia merdigallinarum]
MPWSASRPSSDLTAFCQGASDTIAGFVIQTPGRLAVVGDGIDAQGATIQVVTMDRRRIAELLVTPEGRSAPARTSDASGACKGKMRMHACSCHSQGSVVTW